MILILKKHDGSWRLICRALRADRREWAESAYDPKTGRIRWLLGCWTALRRYRQRWLWVGQFLRGHRRAAVRLSWHPASLQSPQLLERIRDGMEQEE